ncbi:MAG: hypothetical protein K6E86_08435 [Bacteroidales bacterium]|nr:hypothetical protein [Bacteroidales bacterium]
MKYNPRIKFFCRSFNLELYMLSSRLYREAGFPCVRLTDQTADGYFFSMLNDQECDIAINVDEDCFIAHLDAVLALARQVWDEGWVNAGCSDAAKGCPRGGNAMVTNPFFNIFNLKLMRHHWNERGTVDKIRNFDYAAARPQLERDFREACPDLTPIREDLRLNAIGVEPYYNFFFWLMTEFPGRTLYLDSRRHEDGISTVLLDAAGRHLCSHSWFARQFRPSWLTHLFEGNDLKEVNHTERIERLIREVYAVRGMTVPELTPWQQIQCSIDEIIRWSIKVPQRLCHWPQKMLNRTKDK